MLPLLWRKSHAANSLPWEREFDEMLPKRFYSATTFSAWGPFLPSVTLNETCWPSASVLNPLPSIALKWTKTSGPESCSMKPKPLASLNHFTLPVCVVDISSYSNLSNGIPRGDGLKKFRHSVCRTRQEDTEWQFDGSIINIVLLSFLCDQSILEKRDHLCEKFAQRAEP